MFLAVALIVVVMVVIVIGVILLSYSCFKHQTMLAGKVLDYLVTYFSHQHNLMLAKLG